MEFSKRSRPWSEINRLTERLAAIRRAGEPVLDWTLSSPLKASLPYDRTAVDHALRRGHTWRYDPHPLGLYRARQAIAAVLHAEGMPVQPEQIAITSSTSEAYAWLFKLLCAPGEGVAVPAPSYPLFEQLAGLEHVELRPYGLRYDGHWYVDEVALRYACGSPSQHDVGNPPQHLTLTRALVTVHPNNPTGSYLSHEDSDLLMGQGLPLICDEVFGPYRLPEWPGPQGCVNAAIESRHVMGPRSQTGVGGDPPVLTFHLDGLSKRAGLPHLKLGWIAVRGPSALVNEAMQRLEWIADAYLSPNAVVQEALPELLASSEVVQHAIRARIAINYAQLLDRCQRTAVTVLCAQGGWYATLRLPHVQTDEQWALTLLEQARVYTHPGYLYDFDVALHGCVLVVSLLLEEEDFERAVTSLLRVVRAECGAGLT
jgi:alanine-synthesizing transaminase